MTASSPEDPIADAAAAALSGGLVVIPTDTVYGVGTRPDDPAATRALFVVKGRPRDLGIPVLVASSAEAEEAAVLDDRARLLAARFWPGPLSLVLPRTDRSRGWDLGGDATTIAVRIPRHPLALAVLSRTGPLAVTSANRSGEPTPATLDGVRASLGDAVAVYLGEDRPLGGDPSTVVDLAGDRARVLREGAVPASEVRGALGEDRRAARRPPEGPR